MHALRFIEKPDNGQIRISLPDSFSDDLVEIIVLPVVTSRSESPLNRLQIAQQYLERSKKSSFDTSSLDPHEQ